MAAHSGLHGERDSIAAGLAALAGFFIGDGTLGDALRRLADLACGAMDAQMAGITMLVDDRPATAVFTHPDIVEIDQAQYGDGAGPCLTAWQQQSVVRIDDTTTEARWRSFCAAAAAAGIRSTLSLSLARGGVPLGALNLYSRHPAHFAERGEDNARMWASAAGTVLANATVYQQSRQLNENLSQALTSRATIDQAVGIILAGGGRTPEEGFAVLVHASQRENRKLRDIAAEMVAQAQDRAHGAERHPGAG